MIASAGAAAEVASVIGNACLVRGIMTTALIVSGSGEAGALNRTVAAPRPHATMLVTSAGEDYIPEILSAIRA